MFSRKNYIHKKSTNLVLDGVVSIPQDFLGMHMPRHPISLRDRNNPDPPPSFQYGTFRTHDGNASWRSVNPSNGVFTWADLDTIINYHHSNGRNIMYTFFGTPQWAAQSQYRDTQSVYFIPGFCSPPELQSYAANFITALLTRYNTGGTKKIKYLEVWNEPEFSGPLTNRFWWGTAQEMVDLTVTVYNAAKAVDPDIQVLSPAFTHEPSVNLYFDASGSSGQKAVNFIDAFAFHPYVYDLFPQNNTPLGNLTDFKGLYNRLYEYILLSGNPNLSIYITEYGIGFNASAYLTSWLNLPPKTRMENFARRIIINGLYGAKMLAIYSYGHDADLSGDLINDTDGAIAAINFVNQNFVGKTITHAVMGQDGKLDYIADGIKYSI